MLLGFFMAANAFKPGLVIPAYWYPKIGNGACTDAKLKLVANSGLASRTIVIVNPNDGPSTDTGDIYTYTICNNFLRNKGVKIVGYTHTKTGWPGPIDGYRPIADVKAEIDTWYASYNIDGIFIDEVSNLWVDDSYDSESTVLSYNAELIAYI
jgi:hypothetical protein